MELNRRNVVRRLKPSKGLFTLIFTSLTMLVSLAASADVYIEPEEFVVFYHHDVLGSPVTATNEKGQVLWHERNSSYGKSEGRISQNANPFGDNAVPAADSRQGYTGHTLDNSVGLTYMKARYYDHNLGRFLSNDPVGYTFRNPIQSFNRYAYANNNPYIYTDPDGEAAAVVFIGASALFLGALVVAYNNAVNGPSPELISGFSNFFNSDKNTENEDTNNSGNEEFVDNGDGLPVRDSSGKVHGILPTPEQLRDYDSDELEDFAEELEQSIEERIRKTNELGSDKAHGERQNAEQETKASIDKILSDRETNNY